MATKSPSPGRGVGVRPKNLKTQELKNSISITKYAK
jgi:hypothetical protein